MKILLLYENLFFKAFVCLSVLQYVQIVTRMTTLIKAKFKKSNDQTNIEKFRVDANIAE